MHFEARPIHRLLNVHNTTNQTAFQEFKLHQDQQNVQVYKTDFQQIHKSFLHRRYPRESKPGTDTICNTPNPN